MVGVLRSDGREVFSDGVDKRSEDCDCDCERGGDRGGLGTGMMRHGSREVLVDGVDKRSENWDCERRGD